MRILDGPRAIFEGIRAGINGSTVLRHIRNRRLFPGLYLHPTVNHVVEGEFRYGSDVSFSEGCNLIVPRGALLSVGKGCYVGRYVELGPGVEIDIGGQTSIQDRSIIVGDVSLGRYCVLSLNVLMTSGTHYFEKWPPIHIRDQDLMVANDPELSQKHSRKISVGEDCWFGMNSVVMPGVSIGRGCVIGANAVVTKNLTPYSVVAGIPARVIKTGSTSFPRHALSGAISSTFHIFTVGLSWQRPNARRIFLLKAMWRLTVLRSGLRRGGRN